MVGLQVEVIYANRKSGQVRAVNNFPTKLYIAKLLR